MGDRIRELAAGPETERQVEPPIANPEQDGCGQPVPLPEVVAVEVDEVGAVPAQ